MNVDLSAAVGSTEGPWLQLLPLAKVNKQNLGCDRFFKWNREGLTAMEGSHPCA